MKEKIRNLEIKLPPLTTEERFVQAAYRVTRIVLIAKGLLEPGKSLYESVEERLEGDIITLKQSIKEGSFLEAIRVEAGALPSIVTEDLDADDIEKMSAVFMYAAIQAGYDPSDACLHWFNKSFLEEFWPTLSAFIDYEGDILNKVGAVLIEKGRAKAFVELQKFLGNPSHSERKDWTALPLAYVRDFQALTTEDDRGLMIARLEHVVVEALDQLDVAKAHSALRTIAQVQGLTFQDDEKSQRQFALLFAKSHERSSDMAVVRDSKVTKRLTGS